MARAPTGGVALALAASLLLGSACGTKSEDCPEGQTRCGVCVDLQTDRSSCGFCFNVCPTGASCTGGQCVCPAGQEPCRGVCVDPATYATDPESCGACGIACGIGTCAGGVCQCEGATFCAGLSPLCRDLQGDPESCGTCGFACPLANDVCVGGACTCPAALPTPCPTGAPTRCVNTETDAAHCGACGRVCPLTNDVCVGGECACPAALPDVCGSTCVDRRIDEANCGTCGNACAAGATCEVGACRCPPGQSVCGTGAAARCVNLQTDGQNCGTCGRVCPSGSSCTGGACVCGAAVPLACGSVCCAGNDCCLGGTACQTRHDNGVGGDYFDCEPLDLHTLAQARLAAESWSPSGTTFEVGIQCPVSCLCRQSLTQAAVWCFEGSPYKGFVTVTNSMNCPAAACPIPGNPRTVWR